MKTNKKVIILPFLLLTLVSCGEDLANAQNYGDYRSNIFSENMYTVWPDTIKDVESTSVHAIDSDHLVTTVQGLDGDDVAGYETDTYGSDFAASHKLSLTDPDVAYGYTSKLFDGILHCYDAVRSTKSRLQLMPQGFGYKFPREMWSYDYVGLFLKSGADTENGGAPISKIAAHLSFYVLNDETSKFIEHRFDFVIDGLVTSDSPEFYGFYFEDGLVASPVALQGAQAVSFTYEVLDATQSSDATHAVFMYELLLPNSTWR